MESNSVTNKYSGWWRWPLLPFAAVIGAMLGTFLITLLQWFGMKLHGGYTEDGWYFLYILPIFSSAFFGWLYVLITLYVAPKGKIISAIVMTTALGMLILIALLFSWSNPEREIGQLIQSTISFFATMIASIASIVSYKDKKKKKNQCRLIYSRMSC